MTLDDVQTTIVTAMTSQLLGAAAAVMGHRGQFDSIDEIRRLGVKNPAVLVAHRGFNKPMCLASGQITATVQWVVYVLTMDKPTLPRNRSASALVAAISALLDDQRWGIPCGAPEDVAGRNITTTDIDAAGMCLWSITWLQAVPMAEPDSGIATLLGSIFAEHRVAEAAPLATDLITLSQGA